MLNALLGATLIALSIIGLVEFTSMHFGVNKNIKYQFTNIVLSLLELYGGFYYSLIFNSSVPIGTGKVETKGEIRLCR